jgi:hypothetical protein
MELPRIFADFNNADTRGCLRLIFKRSTEDIERQKLKLSNGLKVIVYDDDELSADAEVMFSEEERIWVAKIDWSKIKRRPEV